MKNLLLVLCFVSVVNSATFWVSNGGYGTQSGSDSANAKSASWFNTAGSWATPKESGKIGPGDTVRLIDSISTELIARASGTPSAKIMILFHRNAKISRDTCSTVNGCLCIKNLKNIVVDGGSNGIIENTNNGTAKTYHTETRGIVATTSDSCTVRNLTIRNMYVNTGNDNQVDQTQSNCIYFSGDHFELANCTMHDVGWAIRYSYGNDTNCLIHDNTVYNTDHGIAIDGYGSVFAKTIKIYNNHFYDYQLWDTDANTYHHDGIHAYATVPAKATDLWIYNNTFDGDGGVNITGQIFLESGVSPWTDADGTAYIFNNVLKTTRLANYIMVGAGMGKNWVIANNTIIGAGIATNGTGLALEKMTNATVRNNVIVNCYTLNSIAATCTYTDTNYSYNIYGHTGTFNGFIFNNSTYTSNFTTWKTACDCDTQSAKGTSLVVDTSTYLITPSSAAYGTGANLSYLNIASLNSDRVGNARTGTWDAGAYEYTLSNVVDKAFFKLNYTSAGAPICSSKTIKMNFYLQRKTGGTLVDSIVNLAAGAKDTFAYSGPNDSLRVIGVTKK